MKNTTKGVLLFALEIVVCGVGAGFVLYVLGQAGVSLEAACLAILGVTLLGVLVGQVRSRRQAEYEAELVLLLYRKHAEKQAPKPRPVPFEEEDTAIMPGTEQACRTCSLYSRYSPNAEPPFPGARGLCKDLGVHVFNPHKRLTDCPGWVPNWRPAPDYVNAPTRICMTGSWCEEKNT